MNRDILNIISQYLEIYDEEERLSELIEYVKSHTYEEIIDWNNFDGHIVSSGFIYSKKYNKFLVLYHKDLKMYLYPGGHVDINDVSPFEAAIREVREETSLSNLISVSKIPIDIDIHLIGYNERLDLPEHYHFDFRYLFMVDDDVEVISDNDEMGDYKWIDIDELKSDIHFGNIVNKLEKVINDEK